MPSLRVTAPDGSLRTLPFHGSELTVGRTPDNVLVLEGAGVSSHHCAFVAEGDRVIVVDRGSTNGTFVNNTLVRRSDPLGEYDRIYVGQYLLQLGNGVLARPMTRPPAGRPSADARPMSQREDRARRHEHARLQRHAEQWEAGKRADHLALRPHELRRARVLLAAIPPDQQQEVTSLQRELIEASRSANRRMTVRRGLVLAASILAIGGLTTATVLLWPAGEPDDATAMGSGAAVIDDPPSVIAAPGIIEEIPPVPPEPNEARVVLEERIVHVVIPEETLEDIARRYRVTVAQVAEWNLLNPDQTLLPPETRLVIERPNARPLPQQRIRYELEPEDASWNAISERFGVSATKLRAYNPGLETLRRGQEIVIWIDPHPYEPKEPRTPISDYVITTRAESVGSPNAGSLENGIQLPESPLYIRRYENIMWGSGYLVANVQKAVAMFRSDMDFDGTLVMADISKQKGGRFSPPHGSHQTGRDIDIWLPTLRGVFKPKYLDAQGDEKFGRRPNPEEVDWFATWGLIRALIQTGAVQDIFLTYSIQPRVYDAAKLLGASDEELDVALQWPRYEKSSKGIVMHEPGHTHHMHVRFKCAPYEKRCRSYPTNDGPEL